MSLYVFRPRRSQSGTMPSWGILTASMKIVNTSCAVRNYSRVSFSAPNYPGKTDHLDEEALHLSGSPAKRSCDCQGAREEGFDDPS